MADWWFRIRTVLGLGRAERELEDELAFHVAMETEKYRAQGLSEEAARARAERAFGGVTRQRQAIRDGWGIGWLRDLGADLRHALRQLRLSPGFTAATLLTLALGIGATTAIASIVRQVLLRQPPAVRPGELVAVYTSCRRGDLRCSSSYPDFVDYRDRSSRLADLAATSTIPLNVGAETSAHLAVGELVSGNYFGLMGLVPLRGRLIQPGDDLRGAAAPVAVLSHRFWRAAFGADSGIVGREVQLNGSRYQVIGIGPAGFDGLALGRPRDVWLPMHSAGLIGESAGTAGNVDAVADRGNRWIGVLVGRLAPGATVQQVRQEMTTISARLGEEFPDDRAAVNGFRTATVDPAGHYILPVGREAELRRFLALLLGTVVFTLLLACANVANLLLARATGRGRELGVQLAIGAGRPRLIRKLLTESLLLGLGGAAAGLGVAAGMLRLLSGYELPGGVSIGAIGVSLDPTILLLALTLAVGTALLFGLAPAWYGTRSDLTNVMKGTVAPEDATGMMPLRRGLVAAQVALCVVLVVGSTAFTRTLRNSLDADLGFTPGNAAMLRFNPTLIGVDSARHAVIRRDLLDRVRSLPGVDAAGLATLAPFQGGGFRGFFATIAGYTPAPEEEIRFDGVLVGGDYFRALGMAVREGRALEAADGTAAQAVAVVNQHAADRYWAGRSPVGGTIALAGFEATVVGVVGNPTWNEVGEEVTPFVFLPMEQFPGQAARGFLTVVARSASSDAALSAVRTGFSDVLPSLSATTVAVMDDLVGTALMPQRLGSLLLGGFGVLALVLAGIGIYGVVGYSVSRRARELGIRIAVGATNGGILRTVMTGMAAPVLLGLGIGTVAAVALAGSVSRFMYQASPTDPVSLAGVALLLLVIAAAATVIPARRATRIDPVRVLTPE